MLLLIMLYFFNFGNFTFHFPAQLRRAGNAGNDGMIFDDLAGGNGAGPFAQMALRKESTF